MLDLALSVLFSSIIFVVFKLFSVYGLNTLHSIVVNYMVAFGVGMCFYQGGIVLSEVPGRSWFWPTLLLGLLFIVVFNLMAATAQKVGVSTASVATKMSLVVPVVAGVLLYQESLSALQIAGIALALAAVYFASAKGHGVPLDRTTLLLPILVFLGSGIIDTSIKYFQERHMTPEEYPLFSATVFGAAALGGVGILAYQGVLGSFRFDPRNILGGLALGIPNYFSVYYLLRALRHPQLNSASVFTINNVAIVMCTTLLGIALFGERPNVRNWAGILLAAISIVLVALF